MPLSLEEVFKKAGKEEIAYVYDAPIHYVVLTRFDNTWTIERATNYCKVLDQIEASEGPGVMVTVGTGPRHFSTGFDLSNWAKDFNNMRDAIVFMAKVQARLLAFPMPTLTVFNGTAMAGGFLWSLTMDSRIMNANVGSICLSELKLGFALYRPYMLICAAKLRPSVCNKLAMGVTCD